MSRFTGADARGLAGRAGRARERIGGAAARRRRAAPGIENRKGTDAMDALIPLLTIFMLAVFVGFEIITRVPPLLHTPLMSGSNAISGITLIGAMLSVASPDETAMVLGLTALVIATINVVGGFLVTHRMLGMFRKKD